MVLFDIKLELLQLKPFEVLSFLSLILNSASILSQFKRGKKITIIEID